MKHLPDNFPTPVPQGYAIQSERDPAAPCVPVRRRRRSRSRRTASAQPEPPRSLRDYLSANAIVPVLALLPAFLGGATDRWSQGIVLVLLGLLLCLRPPKHSLGLWFNFTAVALFGLAAAAFLPAQWFTLPVWRLTATQDLGIQLGGFVTPQPWLTGEALMLLTAGLTWCYYVCSQPSSADRAVMVRIYCAGVALLAGVSLYYFAQHTAWPFWNANYRFGPFPNRNQTGNLLAIGTLLTMACVHDDFRHQRKTWIPWALAALLSFAGLTLAYSRGAIALFFAGALLWIIILALLRPSGPWMAVGPAIILILASAFMFGGGDSLNRVLALSNGHQNLMHDIRWHIQQDALNLGAASPWPGIGLGNFESQFWLFHKTLGNANLRILHPESDWLWLRTELGWPGLLLTLIGCGLLAAQAFPLARESGWRLRSAALVAGVIFAGHGLIDVSGHRLGSLFPALFVLGLALRPRRELAFASISFQRTFRGLGIVLCAVGAVWLVADGCGYPLPGKIGVLMAKREASKSNHSQDYANAKAQADKAVHWAPLDWEAYYQRAVASALEGSNVRAAQTDFLRARYLNPVSPEVPYNEGVVWLNTRPFLALPAWQEAMTRSPGSRRSMYDNMLSSSLPYPRLHHALRELAGSDPELTLVFLAQAGKAEFSRMLAARLAEDPELRLFSPQQLQAFFKLWQTKGDPDQFLAAFKTHPDWLQAGWPSLADCLAAKGEYRQAYEKAFHYISPPLLPQNSGHLPPMAALQRAVLLNPKNFFAHYALYTVTLQANDPDYSLMVLQKATAQPKCPNYFFYLQAKAYASAQKWKEAWESLKAGGFLENPRP